MLVHEQIINEENNKAIFNLRMQYEAEMKDAEIALLRKEKKEALLVERIRPAATCTMILAPP